MSEPRSDYGPMRERIAEALTNTNTMWSEQPTRYALADAVLAVLDHCPTCDETAKRLSIAFGLDVKSPPEMVADVCAYVAGIEARAMRHEAAEIGRSGGSDV